MTTSPRPLWLVRDPEPLGSYIRPLTRDYKHTAGLIASGLPVGSGVVVDACHQDRSDDLRRVARESGLEVILDPRSVELSTPGGRTLSRITDLPWASDAIETAKEYNRLRQQEFTANLVRTALELDVSAVLAPTHYHDSFPSSWFDIDLQLAARLRDGLNAAGSNQVNIYFPLVTKLTALLPELERRRVLEGISTLAREGTIQAVWLRMHGFGSTKAGPLNLSRYIELARDLHATGLPIVAERTGTVGIALLAFGAVSGIESGVTHGERYDVRPLVRPSSKSGGGFTIQPRIYLPQIGAFLTAKDAKGFFASRNVKNWFACQETCCRRGIPDMLDDPRRHFLVTRAREVDGLARVPMEARVEHYFTTWLRVASDRAARAARVHTPLSRQREILDQWRITLSEVRDRDGARRPSVSPSIGGLRPPPSRRKSSGNPSRLL